MNDCDNLSKLRAEDHFISVIAEDTIESRVLDIQERKRTLIKHVSIYFPSRLSTRLTLYRLSQAFSGTKAKETQRSTKKEARLQGESCTLLCCALFLMKYILPQT